MKKLNLKKIRWIIREMEKGELSIYQTTKLREHDYSAVIKNIVEQQLSAGKF